MFSDLLISKYPKWMQQVYKEQFITMGYKPGVNYLKYCEILNIMEPIHQARAGPTIARLEHSNPTASGYQLVIGYPGQAPGMYMTFTPPGSVPDNWVMAPDFQSWVQLPPPQYEPVLETCYAEACHDYCPVFTLCSTTGETKPLHPLPISICAWLWH